MAAAAAAVTGELRRGGSGGGCDCDGVGGCSGAAGAGLGSRTPRPRTCWTTAAAAVAEDDDDDADGVVPSSRSTSTCSCGCGYVTDGPDYFPANRRRTWTWWCPSIKTFFVRFKKNVLRCPKALNSFLAKEKASVFFLDDVKFTAILDWFVIYKRPALTPSVVRKS